MLRRNEEGSEQQGSRKEDGHFGSSEAWVFRHCEGTVTPTYQAWPSLQEHPLYRERIFAVTIVVAGTQHKPNVNKPL